MCIQIDNPITVSELVERWKNIEVDGVKFGFHTIIEMFKAGEFNIYRKVAPSPRNGKMGYKCEEFTESMKEFMQFPDDGKYYILDLMEVEKYELNFKKEFTPSLSDVCARFMIPEDQLLRMLYNMAKGKEIPNPHSSSRGWSITTRLNDVSTAFFYDGDLKEKLAESESSLAHEKSENEKLRVRLAELESKPSPIPGGGESADEDFPPEYEGHGIFTGLAKLIWEKASLSEINRYMHDDENKFSDKELGMFFHHEPSSVKTCTLRKTSRRIREKK